MARKYNQLSPRRVSTVSKRGRYADGGGLYLQVSENGAKSWLFRYMMNNKSRQMGLGSARTFSLPEAREKATERARDMVDAEVVHCSPSLADGLEVAKRPSKKSAKNFAWWRPGSNERLPWARTYCRNNLLVVGEVLCRALTLETMSEC